MHLTFKAYTDKFMKYRFLLRELVIKRIKLQYRNSVLGVLWTFLQPLLTMIVLTFVFSNIFGRNSASVVNYPVFLLSGRLLYDFYSQSTKRAMKSIRGNASIIKKVYVPKYIYPLSVILSTFVTFIISLSVLALVIGFFNIIKKDPVPITPAMFFVVVPILILFVMCLGIGMLLATLDVFFKDIENLYDVFTMLLFYVTPIVYTIDKLGFADGSWQAMILKLNPLCGIIDMFRAAVLHSADFTAYFDPWSLAYCSAFAVGILLLGTGLFYKLQDKFILHI
jgi:ABC-2 type transport system permease protein